MSHSILPNSFFLDIQTNFVTLLQMPWFKPLLH